MLLSLFRVYVFLCACVFAFCAFWPRYWTDDNSAEFESSTAIPAILLYCNIAILLYCYIAILLSLLYWIDDNSEESESSTAISAASGETICLASCFGFGQLKDNYLDIWQPQAKPSWPNTAGLITLACLPILRSRYYITNINQPVSPGQYHLSEHSLKTLYCQLH